MEITILMPCLNEEQSIGLCIRRAQEFLCSNKIVGEVLIADNGSTDRSQDIAKNLGARVIIVEQKGYGAVLSAGIQAANGKYIIMGDADASYDFLQLNAFIENLRNGYQLVMGNRFKGGIKPGAMPFLNRYLGNPVLSWIGRKLYCVKIRDFHSGLRGFHRDAMQALHLETVGMEFATEMVLKAALRQLKITEVPIILYPDQRNRTPHLRRWRDGWRHLKLLLFSFPVGKLLIYAKSRR